jgi:hypothetical protein
MSGDGIIMWMVDVFGLVVWSEAEWGSPLACRSIHRSILTCPFRLVSDLLFREAQKQEPRVREASVYLLLDFCIDLAVVADRLGSVSALPLWREELFFFTSSFSFAPWLREGNC